MRLMNLTPHPLRLQRTDGSFAEIPTDGPAPRLVPTRTALGELCGLPLVRTVLGAPEGLPPPQPDVVLIVSALVAEACPGRDDLVSPGEAIRDADGRIVGARGLAAGPGMAARR